MWFYGKVMVKVNRNIGTYLPKKVYMVDHMRLYGTLVQIDRLVCITKRKIGKHGLCCSNTQLVHDDPLLWLSYDLILLVLSLSDFDTSLGKRVVKRVKRSFPYLTTTNSIKSHLTVFD